MLPAAEAVAALGLPVIGDDNPGATAASGPPRGESESQPPAGQQSLAGRQAEAGSETSPFVLGESLPSVPARIVKKIEKGEYVDMVELLRDNAELERRRGERELAPGESRRPRREVPDLLSWIQCFSAYAGIVARQHPEKTRELFAYMAMVVREARRCGGGGWHEYDAMFRQLAATTATCDWSSSTHLYTRCRFWPRAVVGGCAPTAWSPTTWLRRVLWPRRSQGGQSRLLHPRGVRGSPRAGSQTRSASLGTKGSAISLIAGTGMRACVAKATIAAGSAGVHL